MGPKAKVVSVLLLSMVFFGILMTGCREQTKREVVPPPTPPAENKPVGQTPENKYISKVSADPRGNEEWTELAAYAVDLDADGTEEEIALFTAAQRDAKGNMMWDDGQKWLLVVKDGAAYYPLYQEYVQLGRVYFNVAEYGQNTPPKVLALVSTGAGLCLTNFVYESEEKGFRVEPVYDSGAINLRFSTLHGYE